MWRSDKWFDQKRRKITVHQREIAKGAPEGWSQLNSPDVLEGGSQLKDKINAFSLDILVKAPNHAEACN